MGVNLTYSAIANLDLGPGLDLGLALDVFRAGTASIAFSG